jgi:GNAT superfamily N-acetyltransferase
MLGCFFNLEPGMPRGSSPPIFVTAETQGANPGAANPVAKPAQDFATYRADEVLRDGRRVTIRALQPLDREALSESFARTGDESRYRRFFTSKHSFSEGEIQFFVHVNFTTHVAMVAELEEAGQQIIAGGGRYVVCAPRSAEVAFMVDDAHQGLGIGSLLMRHLVACARSAGLATLVAEVLSGNSPMLKVFERAGLALQTRREAGVLHLDMRL